MKELIYEDCNLKTGFSYSVYRYGNTYLVYECNQDGHKRCFAEFTSREIACAFVRKKCQ
jgi:hypothetical protein